MGNRTAVNASGAMNVMRLVNQLLVLGLATLLVSCSDQANTASDKAAPPASASPKAPSSETSSDTSSGVRLTVIADLKKGIPLYAEGAVPLIELSDQEGKLMPSEDLDPLAKRHIWTNLKPGSYQLIGALQPCDGNCAALGQPQDKCQAQMELSDDHTVRITLIPTKPCVISQVSP
jgi:hypothetical protein